MPGGDRTGPMGMGAMTGRGAGYCSGWNRPGTVHPAWGSGGGWGMGRGRGARRQNIGFGGYGRRNRYFAAGQPGWMRFSGDPAVEAVDPDSYRQPDPERPMQVLKRQADDLRSQLEILEKRLAQMEADDDPH